MSEERAINDVFLHPGQLHWGDESTRIRTLLGSCVAICLWHPVKRIGGMCHYMLPARPEHTRAGAEGLDGRYAEEAMEIFMDCIRRAGTRPVEYVAKMFGGSSVNFVTSGDANVAERNVAKGRRIVQEMNLNVVSENLGGDRYRKLQFDLWTGTVWMKRQSDEAGGNKA